MSEKTPPREWLVQMKCANEQQGKLPDSFTIRLDMDWIWKTEWSAAECQRLWQDVRAELVRRGYTVREWNDEARMEAVIECTRAGNQGETTPCEIPKKEVATFREI